MKISVVMATYNGEKYIKEQLDSIFNQSLPVDEVIISDDGSTDSTLDIVRKYNDSRIIILNDNSRHGFCGNFEHAISNTTGDYIFLADQDDVWAFDKVEQMIAVFKLHTDATLVFSNANIIDGNGDQIKDSLNERIITSDVLENLMKIVPRENATQYYIR